MDADTQRILNGEPVDGDSVNKVEEPPKEFKDWMEKNEKRIAEARKSGTLPGFVRENERIVEVKGRQYPSRPLLRATSNRGAPISMT